MIDLLDGDDIANDVMMSAIQHKGSFLLVEGEADYNLFLPFAASTCDVTIGFGKANVLAAVTALLNRGFRNALGIIDADFFHVEGKGAPNDHILLTDHHDLEVLVLASPALQKILNTFASPEKLESFRKKLSGSLLEWLARQAYPIGTLLQHSLSRGYGLCFSGLGFHKFIDPDTLKLDASRMVGHILGKSPRSTCKAPELLATVSKTPNDAQEALQVSRGDDILEILGIALTRTIGSRRHDEVRREKLASALVLAYDSRYFQKTKLYDEIKNWEVVKGLSILQF